MADTYDGPVGFGSDGVHYPLDDEDHLDTSRPLRWVEGATYRDATDDEPAHNDTHHQQFAAVLPEVLHIHEPGREVYPIGTHVVSEDAVDYYLADEYGNHLSDQPLSWDGATQTFRSRGES